MSNIFRIKTPTTPDEQAQRREVAAIAAHTRFAGPQNRLHLAPKTIEREQADLASIVACG